MLHVVGNLCRDTTIIVERFPEPGETLVARDIRSGWGGKGLNQAVAAARTGAPVALHAAVGARDLTAIQADFTGAEEPILRLAPLSMPIDSSIVLVRADGENMIVSSTACARAFAPQTGSQPLALTPGDALLMQGNLTHAVTEACLRQAKQNGAWTVLNPSPLWDEPLDWSLVDLAILNRGELERVTRGLGPDEGPGRLCALGAGMVVVTLGAGGAIAVDREHRRAIPAPSVAVSDTSGAGDVFCGVLVAHLHRGADLGNALRWSVAAAALSVTRPGALASCPTTVELAGIAAGHPLGSAP